MPDAITYQINQNYCFPGEIGDTMVNIRIYVTNLTV